MSAIKYVQKYKDLVDALGIVVTENIDIIRPERCFVMFPQKGRGKRPIKREGWSVGAYWYPFHHPGHMYHTYHIVFDDGTRGTYSWKEITFIG